MKLPHISQIYKCAKTFPVLCTPNEIVIYECNGDQLDRPKQPGPDDQFVLIQDHAFQPYPRGHLRNSHGQYQQTLSTI